MEAQFSRRMSDGLLDEREALISVMELLVLRSEKAQTPQKLLQRFAASSLSSENITCAETRVSARRRETD